MPLTAFTIQKRIFPIAENYAKNYAKKNLYSITYYEVSKIMSEKKYSFESLSKIKYDLNGKISSIDSDTNATNIIRNQIEKEINKKLNSKTNQKIYIPLGAATNMLLLNASGPKIPIKINYSDVTQIDINDTFLSAGINQTRVQSNLKITTEITIILPTKTVSSKITTDVPLSDTVIVGNVPSIHNSKN